jgi:hypothetical protein
MTAICALDIPTSRRVVIRDVGAFLPPDAELWYLDAAPSGALLFMHNLLRSERNAVYVLDAQTGSVTIPTEQADAWSVPRWADAPQP